MAEKQSQSRQLVFVDDEYRQQNPKKRVADRACDDCRRKKKRCDHVPMIRGGALSEQPEQSSSIPRMQKSSTASHVERRSSAVGSGDATSSRGHHHRTTSATSSYPRFIGDLNPERELRSPSDSRARATENSVGVWHAEEQDASPSAVRAGAPSDFAPPSLFAHLPSLTRRLLSPIVDEQCLRVLPPADHLHALETFYFENVHPILPAIDDALYHSSSTSSAVHILQSQVLCVAAHTNIAVRSHLWLSGKEGLLSPAEFARTLLGAIRLHLELALTSDKAVLIRTLATISLFGYNREALELSCHFFARAVHLSWTIGLQLQPSQPHNSSFDGLFCYVWSIDRLHAAMQGHAVMMQSHDMIATPIDRCKDQPIGVQVFVRIAELLDQVIGLYRPNCNFDEIPAGEFTSFEDILKQSSATGLPMHLMETLELFYHAVAILSCRSRTAASLRGTYATTDRQSLAATQIATILDEDLSKKLVLLPYVPYAISLSVSTSHRQARRSQVLKFKERARNLTVQNLRHLKAMSDVYWSAGIMAELATKSLIETKRLVREDETGILVGANSSTVVEHPDTIEQGVTTITNSDNNYNELQSVLGSSEHYRLSDGVLISEFDESRWNDINLDGLFDANLDLNMPTLFAESNVDFPYGFLGRP